MVCNKLIILNLYCRGDFFYSRLTFANLIRMMVHKTHTMAIEPNQAYCKKNLWTNDSSLTFKCSFQFCCIMYLNKNHNLIWWFRVQNQNVNWIILSSKEVQLIRYGSMTTSRPTKFPASWLLFVFKCRLSVSQQFRAQTHQIPWVVCPPFWVNFWLHHLSVIFLYTSAIRVS